MPGARILLLTLFATAAFARPPAREVPLLNVEIVDARGVQTRLVGFHLLNGEFRFQGFLGAARVEVGYERIREIRIETPNPAGGRWRSTVLLRTGKQVKVAFDEREGELLMSGFAPFGRVSFYLRDVRLLKILGRTKKSDLPAYGPPARGVDVRLRDRFGVQTELVRFHRPTGEDVILGQRGASTVAIPLRILEHLVIKRDERPLLACEAKLRNGDRIEFRLPAYAEREMYRGEAEFGSFRIRIVEVRELVVHRPTPALRDLDPVAAAAGEKPKASKDQPPR